MIKRLLILLCFPFIFPLHASADSKAIKLVLCANSKGQISAKARCAKAETKLDLTTLAQLSPKHEGAGINLDACDLQPAAVTTCTPQFSSVVDCSGSMECPEGTFLLQDSFDIAGSALYVLLNRRLTVDPVKDYIPRGVTYTIRSSVGRPTLYVYGICCLH